MFDRMTLPRIKRAYPKLIASTIVGVQPLSAPTGLLYYLRHQYSENRGSRGEDTRVRVPRFRVGVVEKTNWKTEGF
jgi:hypothetical protein